MTSYTIKARLTVLCPITVHGNTLAEAQDNFEKGEWEGLYMDPEATIENWEMIRIGVGSQIGLNTEESTDEAQVILPPPVLAMEPVKEFM